MAARRDPAGGGTGPDRAGRRATAADGGPTRERVPVREDLADAEPYGAPQLDVAVRLNTNETPYPPPASFFEQLTKRVAELDLHRYPDRAAWDLRTALGERFGLAPHRVWVANGSNEVLLHLFQAYGGPGRRVLLFRPGYSMHPVLARTTGTGLATADLGHAGALDRARAEQAVADWDPDLVCLASPNNPTGMSVPADAVEALHEHSRALVVLDEAYAEFGEATAVELLDTLPRLVICRTFSKAWRLAGIRLGYLLAHRWVVDDLAKVRLPYHLDAVTQEAGLVACDLAEETTAHVGAIVAERERLRAGLAALGVEVWPSDANFLLFRTGREDTFERLLGHGVLVRDFSTEPLLEGCLRVTVGTAEENDRFLAALDAVLSDASDETGEGST